MKTSSRSRSVGAAAVLLPWFAGLIAAVFMLSLYVEALHASIERGAALRRAQTSPDAQVASSSGKPLLVSTGVSQATTP
jgi:hypothetical protein